MSAIASIVKREIRAYFVSPIAYTVIIIFLLIAGLGFMWVLQKYSMLSPSRMQELELNIRNSLMNRTVNIWLTIGMVFCLPPLTMRQFAEERKNGTAELLLTSPLTTLQLVAGKYLSGLIMFAMMLFLTLPIVGIVEWKGTPEWPAIQAMYVGMMMFGGVLLAAGLFASAVTENQIVALLLTYAVWLPFYAVEMVIAHVPVGVAEVLAGFGVSVSLAKMVQGVVDTHFFILNGSLIFLFLFLSVQVLDSSRWR